MFAALVWGMGAALRPLPGDRLTSANAASLPAPDPEAILRAARVARSAEKVSAAIAEALLERGVTRGDVRYETQTPPAKPDGFPRTEMAVDVREASAPLAELLEARMGAVEDATVVRAPVKGAAGAERVSVRIGGAEVAVVEIHPLKVVTPESGKPRIAIVIDDVGYTEDRVRELLAASDKITFAVLPYGPHVKTLADELHAAGAEVMLHLPMEPHGEPGGLSREGMLMSSMPEEILRSRIADALLAVPHVSGVNNHMGSRLTAEEPAMKVVMTEMKKRGLFFLDSRTSPDTVAYRAARAGGVRALERDVFLDDVAEVSAILEQVKVLRARATARGSAVAIGHPYPETVRALKIAIPALLRDGFEIVPASTLAVEATQ